MRRQVQSVFQNLGLIFISTIIALFIVDNRAESMVISARQSL